VTTKSDLDIDCTFVDDGSAARTARCSRSQLEMG